jgi:hypothetical protein
MSRVDCLDRSSMRTSLSDAGDNDESLITTQENGASEMLARFPKRNRPSYQEIPPSDIPVRSSDLSSHPPRDDGDNDESLITTHENGASETLARFPKRNRPSDQEIPTYDIRVRSSDLSSHLPRDDHLTRPRKWRRKASDQSPSKTFKDSAASKESANNIKALVHWRSSSNAKNGTSLNLDDLSICNILRVDEDEGQQAKKTTLKQHQIRKTKFFKLFPNPIASNPLDSTLFSSDDLDHRILGSELYDQMKSEMINEWSKTPANVTKPLLVLFAFEIHQQACKIYHNKWHVKERSFRSTQEVDFCSVAPPCPSIS